MANKVTTKYAHKVEVVLTTDRPRKSDIIKEIYEKLGPICTDVEAIILNVVEHKASEQRELVQKE